MSLAGRAGDARTRLMLAAWEGLWRSAEDLLGRAQRRAPKDEATLRGSASLAFVVDGRRFEGQGARQDAERYLRARLGESRNVHVDAEVSFNTPYAAYQHEVLTLRHSEGEAKYLERPLAEQAPRYARIIAAAAAGTIR